MPKKVKPYHNYIPAAVGPKEQEYVYTPTFFQKQMIKQADSDYIKVPRKTPEKLEDFSFINQRKINDILDEYNIPESKADEYYQKGYLNPLFQATLGFPGRKYKNTSKTSEPSSKAEDYINRNIYLDRTHTANIPINSPNMDYIIPYSYNNVVKVNNMDVPVSLLDSLAKHAQRGIYSRSSGQTGAVPLQEALGLSRNETMFGRVPSYDLGYENTGFTDRDLANADYFKNYGVIPANYTVRDFSYDFADKYDKKYPQYTHPLEHAFQLFSSGDYNRGDPNHTTNVRNDGYNVLNSPDIKQWYMTSPYTSEYRNGNAPVFSDGYKPIEGYANGGKIEIKDSNKGKFTAQADRAGMSVQQYASHILANKDRYSPALIKRANFAKNAAKWHH